MGRPRRIDIRAARCPLVLGMQATAIEVDRRSAQGRLPRLDTFMHNSRKLFDAVAPLWETKDTLTRHLRCHLFSPPVRPCQIDCTSGNFGALRGRWALHL
jgi:hypothetical protein